MQPRLQAQIGVLFDREARDALARRDPIEAGRLETIAEHLWETSGFDDDPFVDHGPITARKISGFDSHSFAAIGPLAGGYAAEPTQPAPPPRPAIPWGPVKPPAPAPKPQPAGPPCPKC